MGVTIYSTNCSNDLGSGGFLRLRKTIASLCPDDIKEHYLRLTDHEREIQIKDPDFTEYDAKTAELYLKHKTAYGKVIKFLWASDVEARFSYGVAKQLLKLIGSYDDNAVYGYAGWGDKAMRFKDFKAILKDAAETKTYWGWY